MAEGNDTFMGLSVPLFGESEIKQTPGDEAVDIITITGSTGTQTGDFLVCQTGAGVEKFVIDANGYLPLSSTAVNGFTVTVSSTGAIAETALGPNAFFVQASSKSTLNAVIGYDSGGDGSVASCNAFFTVYGSKAPTYLLSVGASRAGLGAAGANGFFLGAKSYVSAPSTVIPMAAIKILCGTKAYYIPCIPDTGMA